MELYGRAAELERRARTLTQLMGTTGKGCSRQEVYAVAESCRKLWEVSQGVMSSASVKLQ